MVVMYKASFGSPRLQSGVYCEGEQLFAIHAYVAVTVATIMLNLQLECKPNIRVHGQHNRSDVHRPRGSER